MRQLNLQLLVKLVVHNSMVQFTYDFTGATFPLTFTLPVTGYDGGIITSVNWGDETTDTESTHTYDSAPPNPIIVTGTSLWINNDNNTAAKYLISCDYNDDVVRLILAFQGCSKLTTVPNYIPIQATDLTYMFEGSSYNNDISEWDVSQVKNMDGMFYQSLFNTDISS